MDQKQKQELVNRAVGAAECAYAPYSNFHVGAVVLDDSGTLFTGCNVENVSYGLTCCAERVALFKCISEGGGVVVAMALFSPDHKEPISPCGACRQVIMELAPGGLILMAGSNGSFVETTPAELLPGAFSFDEEQATAPL